MKEVCKLKAAKELERALTTESHPRNSFLRESRDASVRLKIVRPWSLSVRNEVEAITPLNNTAQDLWVPFNTKKHKVDIIGGRKWREVNAAVNQAEVEAYIESTGANIIIATDGLIQDNLTTWGGAVWKDRQHVYTTCVHGRTSSFRAESETFEDALTWMAAKTGQDAYVVVLADFQSLAVFSLSGGNR